MDIEKLRQEIEADEGNVHEIYLDHLNLPTFGIGHLVRDSDPEYGQAVGTPVSRKRVNSCFSSDIMGTIEDCEKLYDNFYALPEEAKLIINTVVDTYKEFDQILSTENASSSVAFLKTLKLTCFPEIERP